MTLDEYAQRIGYALADAYNNSNPVAASAVFREADQTLDRNYISPASRKDFWENVEEVVNSAPLRLEKQANGALIALMQSIQRDIALRAGKAK